MNRALPVLLALAFPLLAHGSVVMNSTALAVAAVLVLGLLVLWPLRARWAGLLGLLALVLILATAWSADRVELILMLPPVLLTAAVGSFFARSLRAGSMPLIERVARAIEPSAATGDGLPEYARRWTVIWASTLLLLATINLVLALLATPGGWLDAVGGLLSGQTSSGPMPMWRVPLEWWSLFANGLNYLIIGALFIAEYAHRRWRFRDREHLGPLQFIGRIAQLGPTFWRSEASR
jgi:uncharacterized membrane protein